MSTEPIVKRVSCEELHGEAKEIFQNFLNSGGKVPKWLEVMANCEDTMVGFFMLFKSVMDDSPVESSLKWKIAYVVSEINKCEFCIGAAQTKLLSLGIGEKDLEGINKIADDREAIAIEYARVTTKHAYDVNSELIKKMQENFTDAEIVEITSVVGLFNFINRFNDALRILPDIK